MCWICVCVCVFMCVLHAIKHILSANIAYCFLKGLLVQLWEMVAEEYEWSYQYKLGIGNSNSLIKNFSENAEFDVLVGDFILTYQRISKLCIVFSIKTFVWLA